MCTFEKEIYKKYILVKKYMYCIYIYCVHTHTHTHTHARARTRAYIKIF